MTRKKETETILSQEDTLQVQRLFEQLHSIAQVLHGSLNREQAEAALTDINSTSEASQLALLKALSKEPDSDAADVLIAIHELSPNKNIRKEARRSLIRLEGAKIYPRWNPPVSQTPAISIPVSNPPRFWKGYVTQSREEGEVHLILCWEQGYDYSEIRMMTFIVDFWEGGIKEFILDNTNRRNVETQIAHIRTKLPNVTLADCTLAEARRLLEEALSVNKWRGTAPHKEYRHHLPTIQQLVFDTEEEKEEEEAPIRLANDAAASSSAQARRKEAPIRLANDAAASSSAQARRKEDEDRGLTFISPDLEIDEVTAAFVTSWALGDYGLAYDLLANDSSLRDGQARDEWIEQHRAWVNEAHPTRFELGFIHEREADKPVLWLPSSVSSRSASSRKEIEMGWSLELTDTPLSGTLKEMPMGTAVYKETGRHWFWTSYTLVQEKGTWRITRMTDQGANAQALSISELQQRIKEHDDRVQEILKEQDPNEPGVKESAEEIIWRVVQTMHYVDALIVRLPLDRSVNGDAYHRAIGLGALERAIAYLERIARNFAEQRGEVLRQLGITQESLAEHYGEQGMNERAQHFSSLAQASLHESLAIDDNIGGHAVLAEIIIRQGGDLDEAETHLSLARELAAGSPEEATIEADFGNLAVQRNLLKEALKHYQRAAEIDPNYEGVWYRIGFVQRKLNQLEEAKASFERSIELQPENLSPYAELTTIHIKQGQLPKAREALEQGVRSHPKSAYLLALLSSVHLEGGDLRHANAVLEEAEQINPRLEIVQAMREELNRYKKK